MSHLRHELQKYALTDKMQNRTKVGSIITKLERCNPTAEELMKSKIIKVFRHILRAKVVNSDDQFLLQCKNLYRKFKGFLEDDKEITELQDFY